MVQQEEFEDTIKDEVEDIFKEKEPEIALISIAGMEEAEISFMRVDDTEATTGELEQVLIGLVYYMDESLDEQLEDFNRGNLIAAVANGLHQRRGELGV